MAKCKVEAGSSVAKWKGDLTQTQCDEFPAGPFLGQGSFASAYVNDNDDKRVVKFTADALDAEASARLVGKNVKGAVKVFKVKRLAGQKGESPVRNPQTGAFRIEDDVAIYGIETERVDTNLSPFQRAAVRGFFGGGTEAGYRTRRENAYGMNPKKFALEDVGMEEWETVEACEYLLPAAQKKNKQVARANCEDKVKQIYDAVENIAAKGGIIPLDLHEGNWGENEDGRLVILDLGVSEGDKNTPTIEDLAGMRGRKGQKKMKRHNRLSGPMDGGGLDMTSMLAIVAGLGVLAYLFWPKTAKAEKRVVPPPPGKKEEPTPAPTAGSTSTVPGLLPTFKDEATGVTIDGPSMPITPQAQTYTIKKGESWSNLASRSYGDFRWWPYLWDRNRGAGKFGEPDRLNVGDVIVLAPPPPNDPAFKALIFARANAHRQYWLDKKKNKALKMPQMVYEQTPESSDVLFQEATIDYSGMA